VLFVNLTKEISAIEYILAL